MRGIAVCLVRRRVQPSQLRRIEAALVAQREHGRAHECEIVVIVVHARLHRRQGHRHELAAKRLDRVRGPFEIRLHLGSGPVERDIDGGPREASDERDVARDELVHEPQQEHAAGLGGQAPRAGVAAGGGDVVSRLCPLRGRERARGKRRGIEVGDRQRRFGAGRTPAQARRVEIAEDGPQVRIQMDDGLEVRGGQHEPDERILDEVFSLAPPAGDGERHTQQDVVALEERILERLRLREGS